MGVLIEQSGALTVNGRFIGEVHEDQIVLNAAWCRLAGVGIRVEGDTTDRRRILLERNVNGKVVEDPEPADAST